MALCHSCFCFQSTDCCSLETHLVPLLLLTTHVVHQTTQLLVTEPAFICILIRTSKLSIYLIPFECHTYIVDFLLLTVGTLFFTLTN